MYNIQNMFTNIFIKPSGFYRLSLPVILVLVLLLLPLFSLFIIGYAQDDNSTVQAIFLILKKKKDNAILPSIILNKLKYQEVQQILKLILLI